jgi:hypothetical protein
VSKPELWYHMELLRVVALAIAKFALYVKFPPMPSRIGLFGPAPIPKATNMRDQLNHHQFY